MSSSASAETTEKEDISTGFSMSDNDAHGLLELVILQQAISTMSKIKKPFYQNTRCVRMYISEQINNLSYSFNNFKQFMKSLKSS